jgi:hypothetical protein
VPGPDYIGIAIGKIELNDIIAFEKILPVVPHEFGEESSFINVLY